MAHSPNKQQTKAIEEFEHNLLVSAGAGTGKTSVLTEKFLRLLKERRAEMGEIVAITFTNKAAAEMRQRIRQGIQHLLNEAGETGEADYWKDQLRKVENARICTFHSFCLGLLKEHPLEAGIPPSSQIISDGEELLYLNQAISEVLSSLYRDDTFGHEAFARLLAEYGWNGLLYSCRSVYQTIRESGKSFDEVIQLTSDHLRQNSEQINPGMSGLIRLIEDFLRDSSSQKLTPRSSEILADFRQIWPEIKTCLTENSSWNEIIMALNRISKALPKNLPNVIKEAVIEIRDLVDRLIEINVDKEALQRLPLFAEILKRMDQSYHQLKLDAGLIDFTDQQLLTRNMLRDNPDLGERLRHSIRYILVDEFQDTNSLQLEIIRQLVGEDYQGGRWMAVGDVKQSIYRFRGAEAELIVRLRRQFEAGSGEIVPLSANYRSSPSVIQYINTLSERLFVGEDFTYEPLEPTQTDEGARVEFLLDGSGDIAVQAKMVAGRIKQLLETSRHTTQPLTYKDIVLLFRTSAPMNVFQMAFQEADIPYYMAGGSNFYGRQEIIDQMNLLRLVDQAYDGVALVGLLKSPYVGLGEAEILQLGRGQTLVESFYSSSDLSGLAPDQQERVRRFKETILYLQNHREIMKISELIRFALEKLNYQELCWTFTDASQRLANIDKLLIKADEFSAKGFYSTTGFLTYIKELQGVDALENDAPTKAEDNDVVRMMTIHRSKGLEFPVVILVDLDRRFRIGRNQALIFHKDFGLGYKLMPGLDETVEPSVWKHIKEQDKREEISELKRLLYVALTRAKRHLILAGSGCNQAKGDTLETANNWMKWFQIIHPFPENADSIDFGGISVQFIRELPESKPASAEPHLLDEVYAHKTSDLTADATIEVAATQDLFVKKPITLKVTGVIAYKECPRRFFYRYLQGIPESGDRQVFEGEREGGTLRAEVGTFIHQAARLKNSAWPETLWQRFIQVHRIDHPDNFKAEVAGLWHNFSTSEYIHPSQCWDEVPFLLKIAPRIRVEGRFDRLFVDRDGSLVLVDYKTHRINAGEAEKVAQPYFWQLRLYALAIRELWGRLPDRAELYFIDPNRKVPVSLDQPALDQVVAELLAIGEFIDGHHQAEAYPKGTHCEYCGYLQFCEGPVGCSSMCEANAL